MSQHDMVLDNAVGASIRADLNLALLAIASLNSGATEPATKYAYMYWCDTTSGWLKQRDSANAAWILRAPLGTGAAVDVASAATLDLTANTASSATLRITGTTTTTAITLADGQHRLLRAAGAWPITHGASLICPGSASYTCAAGDLILAIGEATSVVRLMVWKADGTAVVASGAAKVNDFRLTLTTGLPVTTADVTGATTIYCAPYKGNQIALYDGSAWNIRSSAQFSLALGTLTSGKPYDVFCYDSGGTPTLEFTVWTNDTTRATALAYQDGVLVKSGTATRRYLGTFYTTSTTTTEDSDTKRYLWNYYHRAEKRLYKNDTTANWSYTTASWRQARADATNQVEFVCGVAEDAITAESMVYAASAAGSTTGLAAALGLDSTSTPSGLFCGVGSVSSTGSRTGGTYAGPLLGRHYLAWLEYGGTSVTFYSNQAGLATAGIIGSIKA